jgi:hypothetical protein
MNSKLFYLSLSLFFQNPFLPKSNHSWDLWYPLQSGVVNQRYHVIKNLKGQHPWPILNLQSIARKNQRKIVKRTITTRHITDFAKPTTTFAYNLKQILPHNICIEFSSWIFIKLAISNYGHLHSPIHPTPPHSK